MPHLTAKSGIQWHYDVAGEGDTLLFLHGWGVDKKIWCQQLKFFSKYYKVVSVDLPGHGKSSWEKVEFEVMVKDLQGIVEEIQIASLTAVSSSLGGLFALKLYELFPSTIHRMIFIGSMPKFSKSENYPHGLDIERMRKLGDQLKNDYPSVVNVFFRSLFTHQERATRRYKWIQKFRRTDGVPMKGALLEYLDIMETEDLRDVLKDVGIPMQFINGGGDAICTQDTVMLLKELAPQSRFDSFEECGHFPFLSKPYEFNAVMEDFLKR